MDHREQRAWQLWHKAQRAISEDLNAQLDLIRHRHDPEREVFYTERLARFTEAKERAIKEYKEWWPR